jgi:hypothetical protein
LRRTFRTSGYAACRLVQALDIEWVPMGTRFETPARVRTSAPSPQRPDRPRVRRQVQQARSSRSCSVRRARETTRRSAARQQPPLDARAVLFQDIPEPSLLFA